MYIVSYVGNEILSQLIENSPNMIGAMQFSAADLKGRDDIVGYSSRYVIDVKLKKLGGGV
jgi:hypothetical protein